MFINDLIIISSFNFNYFANFYHIVNFCSNFVKIVIINFNFKQGLNFIYYKFIFIN